MDYQQFLEKLSNPARRALLHAGIDSFEKLASHTEKEILTLHGIGKASLPPINNTLATLGLKLKSE